MYSNMNSWFERLITLGYALMKARAAKDWDKADQWKAWMGLQGAKVRFEKDGTIVFEEGGLRNAFNHDVSAELTRRMKGRENYSQLYDKAYVDKLYDKAFHGTPVEVLLRQGKVNLFFWRARCGFRGWWFNFRMRHLHYNWMRPIHRVRYFFATMYYWRAERIWQAMWQSLADKRLTETR